MLEFWNRSLEIPFDQDNTSSFIPWIVGLMIFLATLSIISASSVTSITQAWEKSQTKTFVLEVSPTKKAQVLSLLKETQGIKTFYEIRDADDLEGFTSFKEALPLLLEVELHAGKTFNPIAFQKKLGALSGVDLKTQFQEHSTIQKISQSIFFVSLLIATLVAFAAIITVIFITYTGLATHEKVIDVLSLVGARVEYIANQFQLHSFLLGLKGGAIGMILSTMTLVGLSYMLQGVHIPFLLEALHFKNIALVILLTPCVGLLLISFSARLTVLSALR